MQLLLLYIWFIYKNIRCKKNPDRGVDIILSVEACIESQNAIIQALGIQSLALLCEADVIDFYTAWGVIAKDVLSYSTDPVIANSICLLLRWGAMDAETYPENATNVLQILWEVATSKNLSHGSSWANARESAFKALTQYEEKHYGHPVGNFDLFLHTYTKNHDKITFITEKAKKNYDTFLARREEIETIGEEVDENSLFYEVVGGRDRKRRLYGLGSYGNSISFRKGFSEDYMDISVDKERVETNEKIQKLEELVEKRKEEFVEVKQRYVEVQEQLVQAIVFINTLGETVKTLTNK